MGSTVDFEISIPPDPDGLVLLQCEHCEDHFKCRPVDIKADEVLYIYCPSCGLASDDRWTDEIYKPVMAEKSENANKFNAGMRSDKHPIYSSVDALEEKFFACCERSAKVKPILKVSACFCPFCGVINFGDE